MKLTKTGSASLRAHDVHQGLQAADVDRGSGLVGEELEATQTVGMAAALATAIKGLDVIENGADLKRVSNQQLDIPTWAFDKVIRVLEETEYIRNVERDTAGRVTRLYENVPEDFRRLYGTLDEVYEGLQPGEIEKSLVAAIDELSHGPRRVEELDVDEGVRARLLEVADAAEAIQVVQLRDGEVACSPYFAYEHPELVGEVLANMDLDEVRDAFGKVRAFQGKPVLADADGQVISGLIGSGLMAGPGVTSQEGQLQTFAIAPYGLPPDLLTVRKPILDKAMAILASMRMGEHFGGLTNLHDPAAMLHALLQPGRWVAKHSSTPRQYGVLKDMGIVRFGKFGFLTGMQLIDTNDNKEAVGVAIDLMTFGEAMAMKEVPVVGTAGQSPQNYRSPIQTVRPARKRKPLPKKTVADLWETAMAFKPSV